MDLLATILWGLFGLGLLLDSFGIWRVLATPDGKRGYSPILVVHVALLGALAVVATLAGRDVWWDVLGVGGLAIAATYLAVWPLLGWVARRRKRTRW